MERPGIFTEREIKKLGLEINNGVVRTLNRTGYMRNYLGEYCRKFCDWEIHPDHRFLEIGAGFGNVVKALITKGAKHVVAVDSEPKHLDLLENLLSETVASHSDVELETVEDALPPVGKLGDRLFDRILCSFVLHYLAPTDFELAVNRLYHLLAPGGLIAITVGSPYIPVYQGFAEEYERRVKQRDKYPGFMDDVRKYHPKGLNHNPGFFLVFDPDVLAARISEAGFRVLEASYDDFAITNRETTGLIAVKE